MNNVFTCRLMLLGAGELGREIAIAAKRLGCYIIAVDRYENAPAMQVADKSIVINMQNEVELRTTIVSENVDHIIPEIEAINIDVLKQLELSGISIIPSANAVSISMNRKKLRLLATQLGIKTAKYTFVNSFDQLVNATSSSIGFPCVVKPIMSSSGKGQTVCWGPDDVEGAWNKLKESRGLCNEAIVEEYIRFDLEVTLLTVTTRDNEVLYCSPIGHRQEHGDYQESWQPCEEGVSVSSMKNIATKMVQALKGVGVWGVEFFIGKDGGDLYFSELSPRPHDTGMVTLSGTQYLNQFELHIRAILGLNISKNNDNTIPIRGKGASRAICDNDGDHEKRSYYIQGINDAMKCGKCTNISIFNKPVTYKNRRLGVIVTYDDHENTTIQSLRCVCDDARKMVKIKVIR